MNGELSSTSSTVVSVRPSSSRARTEVADARETSNLSLFVFALFFFFGGITSLNDVIILKLKELFTLSYTEVMTVQSAFFGAYLIISLPAAALVRRGGYLRARRRPCTAG